MLIIISIIDIANIMAITTIIGEPRRIAENPSPVPAVAIFTPNSNKVSNVWCCSFAVLSNTTSCMYNLNGSLMKRIIAYPAPINIIFEIIHLKNRKKNDFSIKVVMKKMKIF